MGAPNEYVTLKGRVVQAMRWPGRRPDPDVLWEGHKENFRAWGLKCRVNKNQQLVTEGFRVNPGEWVVKEADGSFSKRREGIVKRWKMAAMDPDGWDDAERLKEVTDESQDIEVTE